jgi:ankyrin repeat protein
MTTILREAGVGGWTPLLIAAESGDSGAAKAALESGVDIEATGADVVATARQPTKWFLRSRPTVSSGWGGEIHAPLPCFTALQLAAEKGHLAIVNLLRAAGAKGWNIFVAVKSGDTATIENFLSSGGDKDQVEDHQTLLCVAARHDHMAIVKLLINAGADESIFFEDAIEFKHLEVAKLLVERGAPHPGCSQCGARQCGAPHMKCRHVASTWLLSASHAKEMISALRVRGHDDSKLLMLEIALADRDYNRDVDLFAIWRQFAKLICEIEICKTKMPQPFEIQKTSMDAEMAKLQSEVKELRSLTT